MEHNRPGLMIAIGLPHAGEPDGDEDHLDRERNNGAESLAHRRIQNHVDALNRDGPMAARLIKLFATALIHMCDAHMHGDSHDFDNSCDEAEDALHEIIQSRNKRGSSNEQSPRQR